MEGEPKVIKLSLNCDVETPKTNLSRNEGQFIGSQTRVVRTFETDIAEAMKEKKGSVVKIAMAEHKRREGLTDLEEAPKKNNKWWLFSAIILILGGVIFYGFISINKKINTVNTTEVRSDALISSDKEKEIDTAKLSQTKLVNAVNTELDSTIRLDSIERIYLTETVGSLKAPIKTERFFSILGARIPPILLRSLSDKFMLGIHSFNGNQPFIILKTDFYENAFLGLLKWEREMPEDILPLFGVKLTNENRYLLTKEFQDATIKNIDARILSDESGKTVIVYATPNRETIVITTGEDTLKEIILRLNAPKPKEK